MFTPNELESMLLSVGEALPKELDVFSLVAAPWVSEGANTKDVDIILLSRKDLDIFGATLKKLGFNQSTDLEEFYLSAVMVFQKENSRIDLFVRDVCKQLFSQIA